MVDTGQAENERAPLLAPKPDSNKPIPADASNARLAITVAALAPLSILAAFDLTVVAAIWPTIGADFKALNQTAYVATAYHLSNTAFQPLYGRLSDIFGRKQCLLFAIAVFALGTLGCCVAPTLWALIFARFVAGAGGGGFGVISVILLSDLVSVSFHTFESSANDSPVRRRGIFQGFMNIIFGIGSSLGAPVGGLVADRFGWRWAFGIQVPIIAISLFMVTSYIHVKPRAVPTEDDWRARVKRIDFLGSLTLVASISCLIIGLNLGGNLVSWSSAVPLSLMAGFALFAVSFVLVEIKVATHPILAVRLMRARTPLLTAFANFFSTASYFIILFQLPLFYRAIMHLSAGDAGRRLIPGAVGGSLGSLSIGLLMNHYGSYYPFMLFCSLLLVSGTLLVHALGPDSSLVMQFAVLVPCGLGYGGLLTTTLIALLKTIQSDEIASATGMSYLFRATGSIVGISASSNILNTLLGYRLTHVLKHKMVEKIKRDVGVIWTLPKHQRLAVLGVYVDCMHILFAAAMGLAVVAGLCAAGVERKSLKEEETDQPDAV